MRGLRRITQMHRSVTVVDCGCACGWINLEPWLYSYNDVLVWRRNKAKGTTSERVVQVTLGSTWKSGFKDKRGELVRLWIDVNGRKILRMSKSRCMVPKSSLGRNKPSADNGETPERLGRNQRCQVHVKPSLSARACCKTSYLFSMIMFNMSSLASSPVCSSLTCADAHRSSTYAVAWDKF